MGSDAPGAAAPPSQTLSRGIRVLEILADAREPLTVDEVGRRLDVHRSIAYRLVRTLEHHGLVGRDAGGRLALGPRMAALAAGVAHDLQAEALPELTTAANELGMTCFVAVLDHDECVTLVSVEPRHAVASVAQRPGSRHPVSLGAPGKAILSALDERRWPPGVPDPTREQVAEAAARGYATSHDEVIPTLRAVAVPLVLRGRPPAAVSAVYVASDSPPERIAERLARAAGAVRGALGG
ncbi:IclR family transcriptional regulator [Isoptericola variabilis]|uniref:Transcriptional regulator, IclR family n=1 Tax=Isoptericola variabilis (strain 225) TaxID=743718 RepID=F6FXD9_ISOV2|nr:IclR family transcriptional regulator [Isoptericola variabilis]AEG44667.1 transcriptional regulator, IclR family [Isoptericola variabilis 225]TWH33475.1 DNA-binding IclR family transcriptional regulator [Isoptericola variabilis J7]